MILVDSEAEIISYIGDLRKKYLTRQISSSKNTLVQFHEN